jgi:hypothetical protein
MRLLMPAIGLASLCWLCGCASSDDFRIPIFEGQHTATILPGQSWTAPNPPPAGVKRYVAVSDAYLKAIWPEGAAMPAALRDRYPYGDRPPTRDDGSIVTPPKTDIQ